MRKTNVKFRMAAVFALMAGLFFASILPVQKSEAGTKGKSGNGWYTVVSENDGFAQYEKPASKTFSVTIPATVKIGNKTYKVTSVANGALKNYIKVKKLIIGKNVTTIGKNAFYGCKNMKTVTIKTTKLTKSSVGAKSFKGLNAKAVVTVPSEKLASYKEIFRNKGLTGKNQTVKGDKNESGTNSANSSDTSESNGNESGQSVRNGYSNEITRYKKYKQGQPLPEPECAFYSIGDLSNAGTETYESRLKTDSKEYTMEDISFTSKILMMPELYGSWESKKMDEGDYWFCSCERDRLYTRDGLMAHKGLYGCGNNWTIGYRSSPFDAWYFVPDSSPLKVVYNFTIPEGLSYKKNSVRVVEHRAELHGYGDIDSKYYDVKFSGQELTVTIDDIKAEAFYSAEDIVTPYIAVTFDTKMNDKIALDNTASASITYSYKGVEKTIEFGDTVVHTASLKIDNIDQNGNSVTGSKFDLYQLKVTYPEGSDVGTTDYAKIAEDISAGDVLLGLGEGDGRIENEYKIVQTSVPDGYTKAYSKTFILSIDTAGEKTKVSAEDDFENQFPVDGNVVTVTIKNEKSR